MKLCPAYGRQHECLHEKGQCIITMRKISSRGSQFLFPCANYTISWNNTIKKKRINFHYCPLFTKQKQQMTKDIHIIHCSCPFTMLFSVGEMIFTTKRKEKKKKKLQFIAPSSFKQHSIDYRNNWKYRRSYILYHMSKGADIVEYLFFTYSAVYYTGILRINIYVLDMF